MYDIGSDELGKVVELLEQRCEQCLDKNTNPDEIEINIDAIDPTSFRVVEQYVRDASASRGGGRGGSAMKKARTD